MRFVIGLIFGAGLILLAAQQADARWLRQVPAWLDGLAGAAGEALALPPRPPAEADDRRATGAAAAAGADSGGEPGALTAGIEPAQQPIPRPPDPPAPDAARVGAPLAAGGSATAAKPAEATDEAGVGVAAAGPAGARAGTVPAPPDQGGEDVQRLVAEIFQSGAAAADSGRAPVWVPFHSRMSADGFAERLSESLDHPFRVEREGPGRYQVVFAYADESERQALLDEASAVTGLPL